MRILYLLLALIPLQQTVPNPPALPASVEGVVVDSVSQQPLAGATVTVYDRLHSGARMIVVTSNEGKFAFRNLSPGQYTIEAARSGYVSEMAGAPFGGAAAPNLPPNSLVPINVPIFQQLASGQMLSGVRLALTPGGVITGRLTDDHGEVVVGALVQAYKTTHRAGLRERTLVQSVVSNDLGEYRFFMMRPGQYSIAVAPSTVFIPNVTGQPFSIPLFHPGTIDAKLATTFDLQAGEMKESVDFSSIPTRTRQITGNVQGNGSDGVTIVLSPLNGTAKKTVAITSDSKIQTFQLSDVIPGTYELAAFNVYGRAVVPLDVRNTDIIGTRIYLGEGFKIPARSRIEGRPFGNDPALESLYFIVRPDVPVAGLEPQVYAPFADGRFILDLLARDYWIDLDPIRTPDYYVKSMTLDGVDVLNKGLHATGSLDRPLEIVVDRNFGEVQGSAAAPNVTVVLVPDAVRRNQRPLYKSVKSGNGVFHFQKVPPGEYKLFVWSEDMIDNGGPWLDPEYLKKYEERATPVRIQPDVKTILDRPVPVF